MLTNFFRRLSLKVKTGNFKMKLSAPVISVLEPYNDAVDFFVLLSTVFPFLKVNNQGKEMRLKDAVKMFKAGEIFIAGLIDEKPFDIVDVETNDAIVKIGLK